jgi:hypothetical protein
MIGKRARMTDRQPRFCKSCQRAAAGDLERDLCPECGGTVIPQGYCPVCESHWRLPAGATCPKHNVTLKTRPWPAAERASPDEPISWVTVCVFPSALAAAAARIRLEAEGIPTFLEGERMAGLSAYSVATGGAKLQVPHHLFADARVILSQRWGPKSDTDRLEEL